MMRSMRLRRVVRVQRGKDQVSGLRRGEHGLDRFRVAHLADHDHVRILAHGVAQRFLERRRVGADLALRDGRGLVLEEKLDRIFDGDDVQRLVLRDLEIIAASVVDLPEPVGPVTSTRPSGICVMSRTATGSSSASMCLHLDGDAAENRANRSALHVHVGAETGHARHAVAEIDRLKRRRTFPSARGSERQQHLLQIGRLERIGLDRHELPCTRSSGGRIGFR